MRNDTETQLIALMTRLVAALERTTPQVPARLNLSGADAFVWQAASLALEPVTRVNRVPIALLKGIDGVKDLLLENTRRFAAGLPANNALIWGARGMGKSSLVKAVHGAINDERRGALAIVEVHREDIEGLPQLMRLLRDTPRRFLVFCDDLSFDGEDTSYKSLKTVLEGGLEGRPPNVVFYATSNRRHLMPREMMDNERSTAINPSEAVDEKVSLSDRFGLWLGIHHCSQDDFLDMIAGYARHYNLHIEPEDLRSLALEWAATRGGRSGRVAWQFIQDVAGRLRQTLPIQERPS